MKSGRGLLAIVTALVVALVAMPLSMALAAEASGALTPTASAPITACSSGPVQAGARADDFPALDAGQIDNAQIIYNVAQDLRLPPRAPVIAIATALQESMLRNLPYGNADSLGLFQQRPSQGWGNPAELLNPVYAASAFYARLVQVTGWQTLPLTVAAQDVQRSSEPGAYEHWEPLADELVSTFSGASSACLSDDGGHVPGSRATHLPAGFALPAGTPAVVQGAIRYAVTQLGKPYQWGATGPDAFDCSGLVVMAYQAGGVSIPRTTFQQVLVGTPVYGLGTLVPGDLLFSAGSDGTASDPGHVGMYLGSGLVIEAPQTGEPVMITPLAGYWQQNTVAVRRIVSSSL
jgi:cell wall-associated NlpC family hydrolase